MPKLNKTPRKSKKESEAVKSESEEIRETIEKISSTEDLEELKKVLCPFYKPTHSDCVGCMQPDWKLLECREDYLKNIGDRPMKVWSPLFDMPLIKTREKKTLEELAEVDLICNNCYMSEKCPVFAKNSVCGIDWGGIDPKKPENIIDHLIMLQQKRVNRASKFEEVDGGVPDANLSSEMDRLTSLVQAKQDLNKQGFSFTLNASANNPDAAKTGSGILQSIFGGGLKKAEDQKALSENKMETIDIPIIEEVKIKKESGKNEV